MKYLFIFSFISYLLGSEPAFENQPLISFSETQSEIKHMAFNVLVSKCNACHATKKKVIVFTFDNMDSNSLSIYNQVFIKKRMPKGRKNKLSAKEATALKKWLDLTLY